MTRTGAYETVPGFFIGAPEDLRGVSGVRT